MGHTTIEKLINFSPTSTFQSLTLNNQQKTIYRNPS